MKNMPSFHRGHYWCDRHPIVNNVW